VALLERFAYLLELLKSVLDSAGYEPAMRIMGMFPEFDQILR
jgi:hypothetical protein